MRGRGFIEVYRVQGCWEAARESHEKQVGYLRVLRCWSVCGRRGAELFPEPERSRAAFIWRRPSRIGAGKDGSGITPMRNDW
jgi:hypothetical protein